MSSDVIKVHDLPGIAEYSESIRQFSQKVSTATEDTARTFTVKIEGSEGEAISAFLESLNQLQAQVFQEIPNALSHYATVVGDFESSVTGAGFTKEAWTSETGVTTVRNKLTGEQKEELESVDKKLKEALDKATDALGDAPIDLSSITNGVAQGLEDASTARQNTHTPFQEAHDTFVSSLQEVIGNVEALKAVVSQAQITLSLSPKAVFQMISQGLGMNPVDVVKNIDEARALDSVYGDNKSLISQVNQKRVRDEVIFHMVNGIVTWAEQKDRNSLKTFYDQLGKMEQAKSVYWLDKFTTLGQVLAVAHQGEMALKFQKNGGDYKQLDPEFSRENAINEVIGINRGLHAIQFGKKTFKPNGSNISVDDPQQINFEFNSDGRTIIKLMGQASGYKVEAFQTTTQEFNSDLKINTSALNKAEITHRLAELDQKRNAIVFETIRDAGAGVAAMKFPQYRAAFELLKLVGADASDVVDSQVNSEAASIMKGIVNWKEVSSEEKLEIIKLKREMVGKGGWIFEGGLLSDRSEQRIVSDSTYYRFEVSQRIAEMNRYGVKLFFDEYKSQEDFTKYETILRDPKNGYDSDVINYVLGKNSNLSFETMDRSQLEQVNRAVGSMDKVQSDWEADDGEIYFDYLKSKYNRKS